MKFGNVLFYLLWPAVWFYAPLVVRGRAIVMFEGQVLVVKNWFGPGRWQLPGGGMKFGESPIQAIKRELTEELDITDVKGFMLTESPITVQRNGLLLRQHYALFKLENQPDVRMSKELTSYDWLLIEESPVPKQVRRMLVEHQ